MDNELYEKFMLKVIAKFVQVATIEQSVGSTFLGVHPKIFQKLLIRDVTFSGKCSKNRIKGSSTFSSVCVGGSYALSSVL